MLTENGQREISVVALDKVAKFFDTTVDDIIHMDGDIPREVEISDKTSLEQLKLIKELDEEDRNMVLKMIETFLTKKKFKDFFQKNVAAL